MKTYIKTTTTTEPRLVIENDQDAESPRNWDNLGYFITVQRGYNSPDDNDLLKNIIDTTGDEAQNIKEHMEMIKNEIHNETNETVLYIAPIYCYEHGNRYYKRGTAHGFDYSNCGFYIVTDRTQAVLGTPAERFEAVIDGELETYNKWVNGEVYGFTLYDENGEEEDACWGFYDIEGIREHLPEEWAEEDLREYFTY